MHRCELHSTPLLSAAPLLHFSSRWEHRNGKQLFSPSPFLTSPTLPPSLSLVRLFFSPQLLSTRIGRQRNHAQRSSLTLTPLVSRLDDTHNALALHSLTHTTLEQRECALHFSSIRLRFASLRSRPDRHTTHSRQGERSRRDIDAG